jgi:hypothetical protein
MEKNNTRPMGPHPLVNLIGQIVEVHPTAGRTFRGMLTDVNADGGYLCIEQLIDSLDVWISLAHIVAVELAWAEPKAAEARG